MIEYRLATSADADQIAALHADSWRRTYRGMYRDDVLDGDLVAERQAVWRERLADARGDQHVCVARAGGDLAGFICAYGAEDPEWGSLVDNLHVAKAFQQRGIGAELLGRAADWLSASYGDRPAYLWVLEGNASARRFYESLGADNAGIIDTPGDWRVVGRVCRYVWPHPAALQRARDEFRARHARRPA